LTIWASRVAPTRAIAPHLLRHLGGPGRSARQIARGILALQVAPTLERRARARLDQHHFAVEHHAAAADAVLVGERAYGKNLLAATDLAANHPIERAAAGQFLGPLGHHAGGVDVLGLLAALFLLFELLLDPVFEVGDRVAANAEFDEMKGHSRLPHGNVNPQNGPRNSPQPGR